MSKSLLNSKIHKPKEVLSDFDNIWSKRNSKLPKDQTELYLVIRSIYQRSRVYISINKNYREDFFQDFYINKIFLALDDERSISKPKYDGMRKNALIGMMKNYSRSKYHEKEEDISSEKDNTDPVEEVPLVNPIPDPSEQVSINEIKQETVILLNETVIFMNTTENWVYPLALKYARGDKREGSDYPRSAKLGLKLKGTHYTGAKTIEEYYTETLIGRWLVDLYENKPPVITVRFLGYIFKNIFKAALYIDKENKLIKPSNNQSPLKIKNKVIEK